MKSVEKMHSPGFVVVGKVQRAQGIRGELFLHIFSLEASWFDLLKEVQLLVSDNSAQGFKKVTYPVQTKRWARTGIVVKVQGVEDRNRAEELKGAIFEVPESYFVSEPGEEQFYLREIMGFEVRDLERNAIGEIVGFSSNNAQDLAIVKSAADEKIEFDIPLVLEWIVEIEKKERWIRMDLPPGLVDTPGDGDEV